MANPIYLIGQRGPIVFKVFYGKFNKHRPHSEDTHKTIFFKICVSSPFMTLRIQNQQSAGKIYLVFMRASCIKSRTCSVKEWLKKLLFLQNGGGMKF